MFVYISKLNLDATVLRWKKKVQINLSGMSATTELPPPIDLRLRCPFTAMLCGSTSSGKSTFVRNLIRCAAEYDIFDRPLGTVYFFYKAEQQAMDDMAGDVHFIQDMPTMSWLETHLGKPPKEGRDKVPTIIIDDQQNDISTDTATLFSVGSHHYDCNIIFIAHTLFSGKNHVQRDMSLNTRYLLIFKNPRDPSTVTNLGKQIFPGNVSKMVEIYKAATKPAYSYLFIDFDQRTADDMRLRSHMLMEDDEPVHLYQ